MIRDAAFADISAICLIMEDGYRKSHYARDRNCNLDIREAKRLLVQAIQRHGGQNNGACWVQVSEAGGVITGFVLGTLTRVYAVGDKLMATDMFWTAADGAAIDDAQKLMAGMIEWAKACPLVIEVKCGTTAIINDSPERAGLILKRLGMSDYGNIYRMRIK